MRRLMLLRHAKSDWPPAVADQERPLAARGRAEAPALGGFMRRERLRPDLALVSPAKRTRETWTLVAAAFHKPPPHKTDPRLYMATAEGLLDLARAVDDRAETLLMLGHNPGLEEFAHMLIGRGSKDMRKRLAEKFPTAALAVIEFAADDWAGLLPREGKLVHFVTPRSLGARQD
jgi:phosphohistidine phosphatase